MSQSPRRDLSGQPPAEPPPPLQAVAALGRSLAGTLRQHSVFDLFARQIRASFGPSRLAVGVVDAESGQLEVALKEGNADWAPLPFLALALSGGPRLLSPPFAADFETAGLPVPADVPIACLLTTLSGRRGLTGAVAVVADEPRFQPADLDLLQALAALTGVAFESARLVEITDDNKRAWEETVDAISLALCIVDRSGRVERANRAFADLIGTPVASAVGRPWLELVPPGWGEGVGTALSTAGEGIEVELRANDRTFAVTAFPISESDRPRVVLLFEDETERRRLQDQLIQSEKLSAIGQLIAGIAHDLNNPLTSVVGFADFLAESDDAPPRLREPLRVIQQEAERASNIVKNLLSFARKQDHQRRSTPLRPLLTSTLNLLRNQFMAYRVEATLELEPDLPELDLEPNQIQQVFVNLLNNAAQAIATTGRPGLVTIRGRPWLDGVAVDVIDDGPGMRADIAAKVFEPFFTTKSDGEGTGLGLSISQGIVTEHGGRITLTTLEGGGATFTVELPRRAAPAPLPPREAPASETRALRVLVVDDEPHILHYIRATLEAWGHTVETAADGHAGLDRALKDHFDLIISDLRMPRLGGREFYEELKRRDERVARRVAFSTGDTIRGDTMGFLERQGRPCLHKPFSLAELRALLNEVSRSRPGDAAAIPPGE